MRPTLTHSELASLSCRIYQEDGGAPSSHAVILCHGYGAPGDDLVALAPALVERNPALAATRFVFPEGPLTLEELGMPGGRAWWPLDVARFMSLQTGDEGARAALRDDAPEGLGAARRALMALVDATERALGVPRGRVVLGGFSQGAMLACDVALRLEEAPLGLVVLSGTVVNGRDWARRAPARAGLRVFQSHGSSDPILSFQGAEALHALLAGAGLTGELVRFQGGHEIPPRVLDQLAAFLGTQDRKPSQPDGSAAS